MDKRAVDRQLRAAERSLRAEPMVLRGRDGRRLSMRPGAALDLFLAGLGAASGATAAVEALPPGVADWIAEHAEPAGPGDIERLIVRTVRAALSGEVHAPAASDEPVTATAPEPDPPPDWTPPALVVVGDLETERAIEAARERAIEEERRAERDSRRRPPTEAELERRLDRERNRRGGVK